MLGRVDLNNECGDIVATDFFSANIDIFMHKNLDKLIQYHSARRGRSEICNVESSKTNTIACNYALQFPVDKNIRYCSTINFHQQLFKCVSQHTNITQLHTQIFLLISIKFSFQQRCSDFSCAHPHPASPRCFYRNTSPTPMSFSPIKLNNA